MLIVRKPRLYDMELHEIVYLDKNITIMRVVGGWIYQFNFSQQHGNDYSVFVPEKE